MENQHPRSTDGVCWRRTSASASASLLLLLMLSMVLVSVAATGEDTRPNILILLTDDQDIVLGSLDYMPKLKHYLTEQGTYYENAFVHTPICCPSRQSILTGRYIHNGGARGNAAEVNCYGDQWQDPNATCCGEYDTFGVHAQAAGYHTAYVGKYLNPYGLYDSNRIPPGWDSWLGLVGNSKYYNYSLVGSEDGGNTSYRVDHGDDYETDYLPNVLVNKTLDLLDDLHATKPEQPFLIKLSFPTPHGPITVAPWANGTLSHVKAPRTPSYNISVDDFHWIIRMQPPITEKHATGMDERHARRLEMLLSIDEHIEMLIQKLEAQGKLDNTIILYTSDNGFQFGQHRLKGDKRHLYEHDIRVPMVIRGPGIPRNFTSTDVVLNIDIAPTVYHVVVSGGGNSWSDEPDHTMDGMSLLPRLAWHGQGATSQPPPPTRTDFLVSYYGQGRADCGGMHRCGGPFIVSIDAWNNTYHCVRTLAPLEDSMYCRFVDDERFIEFFDMKQDPWQLHNANPQLTFVDRAKYESRILQLRDCFGETCRAPRPTPPPTAMPTCALQSRRCRGHGDCCNRHRNLCWKGKCRACLKNGKGLCTKNIQCCSQHKCSTVIEKRGATIRKSMKCIKPNKRKVM